MKILLLENDAFCDSLGVDIVGELGRMVVFGDAASATLSTTKCGEQQELILPAEDSTTWPAGQRMIADLVRAVRDGGSTACDTGCARRATEIAFAAHASSGNAFVPNTSLFSGKRF